MCNPDMGAKPKMTTEKQKATLGEWLECLLVWLPDLDSNQGHTD